MCPVERGEGGASSLACIVTEPDDDVSSVCARSGRGGAGLVGRGDGGASSWPDTVALRGDPAGARSRSTVVRGDDVGERSPSTARGEEPGDLDRETVPSVRPSAVRGLGASGSADAPLPRSRSMDGRRLRMAPRQSTIRISAKAGPFTSVATAVRPARQATTKTLKQAAPFTSPSLAASHVVIVFIIVKIALPIHGRRARLASLVGWAMVLTKTVAVLEHWIAAGLATRLEVCAIHEPRQRIQRKMVATVHEPSCRLAPA